MQKIGCLPVAAYYIVAVLLTNIKTYLDIENNQVSQYFGYKPLTFVKYLDSVLQREGNVLEENID